MSIRFSILFSILYYLFLISDPHAQVWRARLTYLQSLSLRMENLWALTITNNENSSVDVFLFAEVTERVKGVIFRGETNIISIPPGGKRIVRSDIKELKNTYYATDFKDNLNKTGTFPPGRYDFCVRVFSAGTNALLAEDCVRNYLVTNPNSPRLILPKDNTQIVTKFPIFQWTQPTPTPSGTSVLYDFKVCEILRMQNKYDAIENIPYYEIKDLKSNSIQYPLSARSLELEHEYCWQIQAKAIKPTFHGFRRLRIVGSENPVAIITGENFKDGISISFSPPTIKVDSVLFMNPKEIKVGLSFSEANPDERSFIESLMKGKLKKVQITLTNQDGATTTSDISMIFIGNAKHDREIHNKIHGLLKQLRNLKLNVDEIERVMEKTYFHEEGKNDESAGIPPEETGTIFTPINIENEKKTFRFSTSYSVNKYIALIGNTEKIRYIDKLLSNENYDENVASVSISGRM